MTETNNTHRINRANLWSRIAYLAGIMLLGMVITSILALPFASLLPKVEIMRLTQLISPVFIFILPAVLYARKFDGGIRRGLLLNPVRNMLIWAGVVASMLLIQPTVCLTAWLNEQMALPEFLKPVEIWMRTMEDTAQAHLQLFFNNTGLLFALYNLLVMAVMAGVGEEIFFRGALMSALKRRSSSVHAAIWISAIVFSAFHLQFYGFIPRLMLGAYFGYLVYFTGSIYPAILAHFINNAIIVAFMSIPSLKDTSFVTGNIMPGEVSAYVVATVVTLAVLALGAFRFKFRIEN